MKTTVSLLLILAALTNTSVMSNIARGKEVYAKSDCVACHGAEGRGDGAGAAGFPAEHKPTNFHSGKWKFGGDDASVRQSIAKGRPPYMPGHPQLNPEEVAALSAFVRSLSGKTQ